jgi:hypothetical protein
VLDGVYVDESDGRPGFRPLPAPTAAELHALTAKVARKVLRVLRRRGLLDETVLEDAAADEPALTGLLAESVAFPGARIVDPGRARPATDPAWLGSVAGFNLHAGVAMSALDREGRERLCKYLLRPPLSDDRLSLREDGRVALQLKTPWRDGTVLRRSPGLTHLCSLKVIHLRTLDRRSDSDSDGRGGVRGRVG